MKKEPQGRRTTLTGPGSSFRYTYDKWYTSCEGFEQAETGCLKDIAHVTG